MVATLGSHALKALAPQPTVEIDRSRCARHRCNRNQCQKCIDACPAGAIAWRNTGLRLDSDACTECLLCVAVCPTEAFRSTDHELPRTLADLAARATPVLGCRRHAASESPVRIPCLGALAHPEAMTLLALVFTDGVKLNLTACGNCVNEVVVEAVKATHTLLADLVPGHRVELVRDAKTFAAAPKALSRREMFGRFRGRSGGSAARLVERLRAGVQAQSFGAKQVPETRRLLRAAMADLPDPRRRAIADRLFGRVVFTPQCVPCPGCAAVCPTGALRRDPKGERPPAFDAESCVACGSCAAFCSKQGIALDE